jgi:hypothetical protein
MNHRTVLEDTLQQMQVVLWENGAAANEQSDRLTVEHLRTLASLPDVRKALKRRGNDRLALAVRVLQDLLADVATDRDLIERVWRVVREADLEAGLARYALLAGNAGLFRSVDATPRGG